MIMNGGVRVVWRWFFLLAVIFICVRNAVFGAICLTADQRDRLAVLVRSEPEAEKLFNKLRREADSCLNDPARPVSTIQTAGRLNADPDKAKSRASIADMRKLSVLGFSYAVTTNQVYSAAAKRTILAWARAYRPSGQPIDETKLEPLFVAYDLTRTAFSAEERAATDGWLRSIAREELAAVRADSDTAFNNWNSHRLKIIGLIGYLLDDRPLITHAVEGFRKQIERNLRPDGSSFDFHERDALHYHCYDLEPLLTLAGAARQNGVNLYDYVAPNGACLSKSVRFLVPFCNGSKTHAEWVNSKVAFDRTRAEAGEEKFEVGVAFDPRSALRVFELASCFDGQFKSLACQLANKSGATYPTWQTVINDACRR
jgi:hypothetical protein